LSSFQSDYGKGLLIQADDNTQLQHYRDRNFLRPLECFGDLDLAHDAHLKSAIGYVSGFVEPEPCESCLAAADATSAAEPFFMDCISATRITGADPSDSSTEFLMRGGCANCNVRNHSSNCSLNKGRRLIDEPLRRTQDRHSRRDPASKADERDSPSYRSPPSVPPRLRSGAVPLSIGEGQVAWDQKNRQLKWNQGDDWSVTVPQSCDVTTQAGRNEAMAAISRLMGEIAQRGSAFEPKQGMTRTRSQASLEEIDEQQARKETRFVSPQPQSSPNRSGGSSEGGRRAPTHISRDDRGVPLRGMSAQEWQAHSAEMDIPGSSQERGASAGGKKTSPKKPGRGRGRR
jgi:hypothetical protein